MEIEEQKFFKDYGDCHVKLHLHDFDKSISLEDLYQLFKARMKREAEEVEIEDDNGS